MSVRLPLLAESRLVLWLVLTEFPSWEALFWPNCVKRPVKPVGASPMTVELLWAWVWVLSVSVAAFRLMSRPALTLMSLSAKTALAVMVASRPAVTLTLAPLTVLPTCVVDCRAWVWSCADLPMLIWPRLADRPLFFCSKKLLALVLSCAVVMFTSRPALICASLTAFSSLAWIVASLPACTSTVLPMMFEPLTSVVWLLSDRCVDFLLEETLAAVVAFRQLAVLGGGVLDRDVVVGDQAGLAGAGRDGGAGHGDVALVQGLAAIGDQGEVVAGAEDGARQCFVGLGDPLVAVPVHALLVDGEAVLGRLDDDVPSLDGQIRAGSDVRALEVGIADRGDRRRLCRRRACVSCCVVAAAL